MARTCINRRRFQASSREGRVTRGCLAGDRPAYRRESPFELLRPVFLRLSVALAHNRGSLFPTPRPRRAAYRLQVRSSTLHTRQLMARVAQVIPPHDRLSLPNLSARHAPSSLDTCKFIASQTPPLRPRTDLARFADGIAAGNSRPADNSRSSTLASVIGSVERTRGFQPCNFCSRLRGEGVFCLGV